MSPRRSRDPRYTGSVTNHRPVENLAMTPRVLIITRTKNRPLFLERALASVGGQTFTDYLLVIVNDAGEPEPVEDLVSRQSDEFRSRIRVVHNRVSEGREAALEAGFEAADLEFYAVHDDDDTWAPEFLERAVAALDADAELGGVAVRCALITEHIEAGSIVEDDRGIVAPERLSWTLIDTMVSNFVPPIAQLFRRAAADEVGHWDGSIETQADWDFNLRMMLRHRVGFIDGDPLAFWHLRASQDGEEGNSVYVDAARHRRDNLGIREKRLAALLSGDDGEEEFARLLVMAEYTRRLEERVDKAREELAEVGASLTRLHDRLGVIEAKIDRVLGTSESTYIEFSRFRERVLSILHGIETRTSPKYWAKVAGSKLKGRVGR